MKYDALKNKLNLNPRSWLITGVAGFIGSNLLEELLNLNQTVIGLDNLSRGYKKNLNQVKSLVTKEQWSNFKFIEGDILDLKTCNQACKDVDYVLHEAALGSVPRSIDNPILYNRNNIDGFLNMLVAARDNNVSSFVYAASSSTYGDHTTLPKKEDNIGNPLSPYAVTKLVNELYASVFFKTYSMNTIGLRYFNVFGPRQDPDGAYAAVIPKWISALLKKETVSINGDGKTSRDFCYVTNVIQANILAATTEEAKSLNQIYNVALGDRTTLNELFNLIVSNLSEYGVSQDVKPVYGDFRPGDVRHSQADISKAKDLLEYYPNIRISEGIERSVPWFVDHT